MMYDEGEDSLIGQLKAGKINRSEFMAVLVKAGWKEKRAFEFAERMLYDRYNRMPHLKPRT